MTELKCAIVGCGQIAGGYDEISDQAGLRTHAAAYTERDDVRLVAVADLDRERANQFSRRWGGPAVYENVRALLEQEQPEIVSVCTPDETHAEFLKACLEYPFVRGVWCEKPLATDTAQAAAVVEGFERAGKVLMVNYQRRWNSRIEKVRQRILDGGIGQVQKVVVYYGKGILHNGSHAVDLLLYWFGNVRSHEIRGCIADFTESDPTVDARLRFEGFDAYLIGIDSRMFSLFEIDIIGSAGRIRLVDSGRRVEHFVVGQDPLYAGFRMLHMREHEGLQEEPASPLAVALRELVAAVRTGAPVRSDGRSALAVLQLCTTMADGAIAQKPGPEAWA